MQKIDAEKVQKYQDAINGAIRIHTKKATESLPYNKSELVEIVDITERNLGKYIVWNGSTRYYAYSENTTYDIGMKVYVNIPNSDFAAQKTIIGQYVAEGEKSVVWRNPLDAFQPLPDINLLEDPSIGEYENKEYSLLANWNKENSFPEDKNEFPCSQEKVLFDSEGEITSEYQGHTYLGITADFKTRLETFSPIDGDYGLRLELRYRDKVSVLQDEVEKTRIYTLSAKNDMIGNVYNYRTYFTQASLFDISDIENITGIKLSFFQDGDFRRNTNKWIPVYYSLGQEGTDNYREYLLQDNIFVKNIKINVGDDLITKNDKLKIKTLQGLTYSTTQNDALNYKNIELEWDHLDPDSDKFEILDKDSADEKIFNYKIHWYRDAVIAASELVEELEPEEELDKTDWNNFIDNPTKENFDILKSTYHITNLIQGVDYSIDNNIVSLTAAGEDKVRLGVNKALEPPKKRSSIQIDSLAGKSWQSLGEGKDFIYNYFLPDTKKSYSKVMAIVEYNINSDAFDTSDPNYVIVKSNILEFTNEAITSNPLSDDKRGALQITCEDGSNGDYPIYSGITGQLLSRTDVSLVRNFKATCKSLQDGSDYLNGNETIIWQIPKINTMIVINDSLIKDGAQLLNESPHEEIEYDDNYYFIARSANDGIRPVFNTQQYQVAQFFNKACVNNTIYCYIIKNNEVFKASRTLTFNQHGTSGTDYTFTLGFKQKVDNNWNVVGPADTALTIGDINYLEIDFRLFNSKNEEIELTNKQKNDIISLWISQTATSGYYCGKEKSRYLDFLFHAITENTEQYIDRIAIRPHIKKIGEDGSLPSATIENLKCIVFQATVNSDVLDNDLGKIQFTQLLPIHVRAEDTNYVLNGSDYIIYDDKGANPNFYNDKYELKGTNVPEDCYFEIHWDPEINSSSFYPFFDGKKLIPTPLYINDTGNKIWIDCYQNINEVDEETGNEIEEKKLLYTFPLVILQNKYQIPAINKWNGELVVDSNENKVLAAMVGAGHKNKDNTFSGVLMGDIEQEDPYNPEEKKKDTGLFGYDKGAQTFGFNVNGEAFIGASGTGRIYVNGNTGRITSAAREAHEIAVAKGDEIDPSLHQGNDSLSEKELAYDPRGTDINLKENYIDIQGIGNQSRIHLDTTAKNGEAYLLVDNDNGNRLLHVGDDDYYLQTDNYNSNNKTGLKIDLKNGIFNSYDKIIINGGFGSEINFGDNNHNDTDKNYLRMGIDENGSSHFTMLRTKPDINFLKNELITMQEILQNIFQYKDNATDTSDIIKIISFDSNYAITNNNPTLQEFINDFKSIEISSLENSVAQQKQILDGYEDYLDLVEAEIQAKKIYWETRIRYDELLENYNENYLNYNPAEALRDAQDILDRATREEERTSTFYNNYISGNEYTNAKTAYNQRLNQKEVNYYTRSPIGRIEDLQIRIAALQQDSGNQNELEQLQQELIDILNSLGITIEDIGNLNKEDDPLYQEWQNFKNRNFNAFIENSEDWLIIKNVLLVEKNANDYEQEWVNAIADVNEANENLTNVILFNNNFQETKTSIENMINGLFNQIKGLKTSDLDYTLEQKDDEGNIINIISCSLEQTDQGVLEDSETWGTLYSYWKNIFNNLSDLKNTYGDNNFDYQTYNADYNENNSRLTYLKNKKNEMQKGLDDYNLLKNRYDNANNGDSTDGYISINNNKDKRIEIGNKFWVTADGTLHASDAVIEGTIYANAGYLNNINVQSLNFGVFDKNGNFNVVAQGIKPKRLKFLTGLTASAKVSPVPVSVSVSKNVSVPYSYSYPSPKLTKASITATAPNATRLTFSGLDIDETKVSTIPHMYSGTPPGWTGVVMVSNIAYDWVTKTGTASKNITVNASGSTTVDVVQEIKLQTTSIEMWALTNDTEKLDKEIVLDTSKANNKK